MATRGIAETLFGTYRRKVLALLLLQPDEPLHVREISRITGVPAGSLHRELRLLSEAGLLIRETVGNQVRYRANRDCQIFEELASLFRKTAGIADVIREALVPFGDAIEVAFIFGSVAQGQEAVRSDVDLFVIGNASFVSVVQALAPVHQTLGREVNPVVISAETLRAKLRERDHFVKTVVEQPKIYVTGDAHDLGQLAENRPAETARNE